MKKNIIIIFSQSKYHNKFSITKRIDQVIKLSIPVFMLKRNTSKIRHGFHIRFCFFKILGKILEPKIRHDYFIRNADM